MSSNARGGSDIVAGTLNQKRSRYEITAGTRPFREAQGDDA
jgi:hypothetical protein